MNVLRSCGLCWRTGVSRDNVSGSATSPIAFRSLLKYPATRRTCNYSGAQSINTSDSPRKPESARVRRDTCLVRCSQTLYTRAGDGTLATSSLFSSRIAWGEIHRDVFWIAYMTGSDGACSALRPTLNNKITQRFVFTRLLAVHDHPSLRDAHCRICRGNQQGGR